MAHNKRDTPWPACRKSQGRQYPILNTKDVYAVLLVGGKGKRLRPLSKDSCPKPFLSVTRDRKTMFRKTLDRIRKLIPSKNILVAANRAHSNLVTRDFPNIKKDNLVLEPVSRNTAPAIALAAFSLKRRVEDAIMVVLPADQYIQDEAEFLNSIRSGISFIKENADSLLILTVKPCFPATGFGYVRTKRSGKRVKGVEIYKADRFIEKPSLNRAKRCVRDRRYLWNAGGFIFSTSSILKAAQKFAPKIFDGLRKFNGVNIDKLYKKLTDISIDYAVMEKADNIYCVKGSYRWKDIGSFESLKEVLKSESRDFVIKNGKIVKII